MSALLPSNLSLSEVLLPTYILAQIAKNVGNGKSLDGAYLETKRLRHSEKELCPLWCIN